MAKRKDSIEALLKRCETDLKQIEQEYNDSLHRQQIRVDLQVDIKNCCENLRSVLDYIAHDMRETYCSTADARTRFYFPIFESKAAFESQMGKWYPALDINSPGLYNYLETIQPFNEKYRWLGVFNRLNNENKHGNLIPQKRSVSEEVRVSFQGGEVSWNPSNVRFGSGVFIGGVPVDPKTQMPIPHPLQKVEKINWVDFLFDGESISALGLLKQTLKGITDITKEIEKLL